MDIKMAGILLSRWLCRTERSNVLSNRGETGAKVPFGKPLTSQRANPGRRKVYSKYNMEGERRLGLFNKHAILWRVVL
jgi:hypothetical protein